MDQAIKCGRLPFTNVSKSSLKKWGNTSFFQFGQIEIRFNRHIITSFDKEMNNDESETEMASEAIPDIFHIDFSDELEEEEYDEDDSITEDYEKPNEQLFCHPNEELPPIAMNLCSNLYHPECYICSHCSNQIKGSKVLVTEYHPVSGLKLACMKCAKEISRKLIICRVCHDEIPIEEISNQKKSKNTAIELRKGVFVHKSCLHCEICGTLNSNNFQGVLNKAKNKMYIVCENCISIINGGGTTSYIQPYVGRLINDILPTDFGKSCEHCHQPLTCNGFVFSNQSLFCANCGWKEIHNKAST